MLKFIEEELAEAKLCLEKFIADSENLKKIELAAEIMASSLNQGGKIISCGNGGSMSDAMHFAEELTGRYKESRKPLAAIAISDPGYISCVGNDFGYNQIFSRFVEGIGNSNDVLLAISTSGNSENVIKAANSAQNKGMKVIALTAKNGGELGPLADVEIRAPHSEFADRAQEIHIKVIHILIGLIEKNT